MENELTFQLLQSIVCSLSYFTEHPFSEFFQGEGKILNFMYLGGEKKPVTPSQISQTLHFSTPRVAAAVNNLQKKGYVVRVKSDIDRRGSNIFLTDQGIKWVLQKRAMAFAMGDRLIEKIGTQDAKTLIAILQKAFDEGDKK